MVIRLIGMAGEVTELPRHIAKILINKGLAIEVHPEEKPKSIHTRPVPHETTAQNRKDGNKRHA